MGEGGVFRIPAHNSSLLFTFQIRIRAMQSSVSQGKETKHVLVNKEFFCFTGTTVESGY